jgi:hypothetical protein
MSVMRVGFTDPKKPKFELNFEQFLDALAAVATHKSVFDPGANYKKYAIQT